LIRRARVECVPVPGIEREVICSVPREVPITVTCSETLGIERAVSVAESLAREGFEVVPHLAARLIPTERRLAEFAERLTLSGIREAFVVGGDAPKAAGPFQRAADLIAAFRATELAREWSIGVAGYPEGHPTIDDEELRRALILKLEHASYVVTQICFNPTVLRDWIYTLRADSVTAPIVVGAPGVVDRRRLLRMSRKVGVGASLRYLRANRRSLGRILVGTRYSPDQIIRPLGGNINELGISGLHLFTFNQLATTLAWRRSLLTADSRPTVRSN
jgi:methylenetetrahydrofolate reductase (NADPH)